MKRPMTKLGARIFNAVRVALEFVVTSSSVKCPWVLRAQIVAIQGFCWFSIPETRVLELAPVPILQNMRCIVNARIFEKFAHDLCPTSRQAALVNCKVAVIITVADRHQQRSGAVWRCSSCYRTR